MILFVHLCKFVFDILGTFTLPQIVFADKECEASQVNEF